MVVRVGDGVGGGSHGVRGVGHDGRSVVSGSNWGVVGGGHGVGQRSVGDQRSLHGDLWRDRKWGSHPETRSVPREIINTL